MHYNCSIEHVNTDQEVCTMWHVKLTAMFTRNQDTKTKV
jgi:hypothetical protein